MKYTYSDEEDMYDSDATTSRRSTRNTGTHTPAEGLLPTITLSGRQVKARQGGAYGESMLSGAQTPALALASYDGTSEEPEPAEGTNSRPRRAAAPAAVTRAWNSKGGAHIEGYNSIDENDSDEDDASEQDYGDDEEDDHLSLGSDRDEDSMVDEEEAVEGEDEQQSLVVKLPVKTPTPERKTIIKLRVSPEKEGVNSIQFNHNATSDQNKSSSTLALGLPATASADLEAISDENIRFSGSDPELAQMAPITTNASPLSISVPQRSPSNSIQATPLSPLAFRGSPEKPPQAFPQPPINVGYGGT